MAKEGTMVLDANNLRAPLVAQHPFDEQSADEERQKCTSDKSVQSGFPAKKNGALHENIPSSVSSPGSSKSSTTHKSHPLSTPRLQSDISASPVFGASIDCILVPGGDEVVVQESSGSEAVEESNQHAKGGSGQHEMDVMQGQELCLVEGESNLVVATVPDAVAVEMVRRSKYSETGEKAGEPPRQREEETRNAKGDAPSDAKDSGKSGGSSKIPPVTQPPKKIREKKAEKPHKIGPRSDSLSPKRTRICKSLFRRDPAADAGNFILEALASLPDPEDTNTGTIARVTSSNSFVRISHAGMAEEFRQADIIASDGPLASEEGSASPEPFNSSKTTSQKGLLRVPRSPRRSRSLAILSNGQRNEETNAKPSHGTHKPMVEVSQNELAVELIAGLHRPDDIENHPESTDSPVVTPEAKRLRSSSTKRLPMGELDVGSNKSTTSAVRRPRSWSRQPNQKNATHDDTQSTSPASSKQKVKRQGSVVSVGERMNVTRASRSRRYSSSDARSVKSTVSATLGITRPKRTNLDKKERLKLKKLAAMFKKYDKYDTFPKRPDKVKESSAAPSVQGLPPIYRPPLQPDSEESDDSSTLYSEDSDASSNYTGSLASVDYECDTWDTKFKSIDEWYQAVEDVFLTSLYNSR